jgi:hypothetical protein
MTAERDVERAIRLALSRGDTRLFRQHVGLYWQGEAVPLKDGSVLLKNPRRIDVGFEGQPDEGGWTSVIITPEMVGQRIAIAVQMEIKRSRGAYRRKKQKEFIAFVRTMGVRAGFAASVEDAERIVAGDLTGT